MLNAFELDTDANDATALIEELRAPLLVLTAVIGDFKVQVVEYVVGVGLLERRL